MNDISRILEEEARTTEANPDAPITSDTKMTRGHGRAKVLQIRLNPDEFEALQREADAQHLPVSTLARSLLLQKIHARV